MKRPQPPENMLGLDPEYDPSDAVQTMVDLARKGPTIGKAKIAQSCGTCVLKIA